jgi:hypothetical protein
MPARRCAGGSLLGREKPTDDIRCAAEGRPGGCGTPLSRHRIPRDSAAVSQEQGFSATVLRSTRRDVIPRRSWRKTPVCVRVHPPRRAWTRTAGGGGHPPRRMADSPAAHAPGPVHPPAPIPIRPNRSTDAGCAFSRTVYAVPRAHEQAARGGRVELHQRHPELGPGGDDAARRRRPPRRPGRRAQPADPRDAHRPGAGRAHRALRGGRGNHGRSRRRRQPAQPAPRLRPGHEAAHGASARNGGGEHAGHARLAREPRAQRLRRVRALAGKAGGAQPAHGRAPGRAGRRRIVRRAAGEL